MSIKATVDEVIPVTVYQETVYEHRVVLCLEDGTRFGVFDPDLIARPSLVGSERSVVVRAWILGEICACSDPCMRIFPNDSDCTEWNDHRYEGNIQSMEDSDGKVRMQVGIHSGTIKVVANPDEVSEFEPGDGISVTAGRTDLVGIEGVTSLSEPLMRQRY